ncbi:hypothetical protein [Pseudomarimonas salicorniae]|uniref:DUF4174 domain-containing protein n=1 Tax=Pseudomarimonas salicorniae TaxID=2933270 RepID=A0ABT0GLP8_9GAMM|nr:hypothetical protein [Lysobacter sp. CAU 1642]MCK7595481.1 hypothetical protein [Lysobacter sp. CAU 1642]
MKYAASPARIPDAGIRRQAGVLVFVAWLGFVCASFWSLAVTPRLAERDALSEREFSLAAEAWWRSHDAFAPRMTLVVLPGCECAGAAGIDLLRSASGLDLPVLEVGRTAAPAWDIAHGLPQDGAIDALLFAEDGGLRYAFLRANPDHCVSIGTRLRQGLLPEAPTRVWPGLCPCPAQRRTST